MSIRPTAYEIDNGRGIACDIWPDPENRVGETAFYVIDQNGVEITVNRECLQNLLVAADMLDNARNKE